MFHVSTPNAGTRCFDIASELPGSAEAIWTRIASGDGINAELWPIRMHLPRNVEPLQAASSDRPCGVLISLLGVLPIDWHWLGLQSVAPGRGFHEVSSSLLMRRWVHIRTIELQGNHCVLQDHVELTPRLGFLAGVIAPVYLAVFRRRHRALRRYFDK